MAPHQGRPGAPVGAPNAALLIDFDNVTMGIRSDLTKQLKDLLNSDIIKGKVAVQRAYADWRRYAQYIVPLSEASVDLIFAPAYGSSKKNATDIRLAIDALELVFTRPEIGVFILLSGDSDFSSLVLKLKEYGKYVIGVGLRESASDLLVQNCDEYFSYSALTGLTKAGEEDVASTVGPWDLAERAVRQMADQKDVMRSDRLKQVMLELDPSFDESQLGFTKFNRFITEAASKNKLALKKLDNGQYEVQPFGEGAPEPRDSRRGRGGRGRREERAAQERVAAESPRRAPEPQPQRQEPQRPVPKPATRERKTEDLQAGYELLQRAVKTLARDGGAARDSDIKRQMMELQSGWDESELGFTKFSRFLRQAHDAKVIDLQKSGEGYYEATLPRGAGESRRDREPERGRDRARERERGRERGRGAEAAPESRGRESRREREEREPLQERPEREPEGEQEPATQATAAAGPSQERPAEVEEMAATAEKAVTEAAAAPEEPGQPEVAREEEEEEVAPKQEGRAAAARPAARSVGGRRGRRGAPDGPPPLLPGQVVGSSSSAAAKRAEQAGGESSSRQEPAAPAETSAETEVAAPSGGAADRSTEQAARAAESEAAERGREPSPGPATPDPGATAGPREDSAASAAGAASTAGAREESQAELSFGDEEPFDAEELGLPTDSGSVIRYLSNSYPGVGQKTAEALIEAFGAEHVFHGLHTRPDTIRELLGTGRRTDQLLEAWNRDFRRRSSAGAASGAADASEATS